MRYFYKAYSKNISSTLLTKSDLLKSSQKSITKQENEFQPLEFNLSWSHYLKLMRIPNLEERNFYEIEATNNNWSLREMTRQIDSELYLRIALSKDKLGVKELAKRGQKIEKTSDAIKNPYILEFLGLWEHINNPEFKGVEFDSFLFEAGSNSFTLSPTRWIENCE